MHSHPLLWASYTQSFLAQRFDAVLHKKTLGSVYGAVLGTLTSARAGVAHIGRGLAEARGLSPKHAIKQVDRLFSNELLSVEDLAPYWLEFVAGSRTDLVVALDWTEFAKSDHSTLVLSVIAHDKRATPVLWKTVQRSGIQRIAVEDELLERLRAALPPPIRITLLADRGFASRAMYLFLRALQIDFVIRFKSSLLIGSSDGEMQPAAQHIPKHGRTYSITSARITSERTEVPLIVLKHAKGMKESWCLASSRADLKPSEVVNLYGRRFTIEERFRDIKDWRFGMGVSAVQMESSQRRDRLLLINVLAQTLLHILGAAGEALGMSRLLKANTVKSRVHSLYRQGQTYLQLLPTMPENQSEKLLRRFLELLLQHAKTSKLLALL